MSFSLLFAARFRALLHAFPDKLIVMKVFAPWCRACKGLEPKFNAIVKDRKYEKLPIIWADLTIQHNKDYVKSIGVLALPTIQFYVHGGLADNFPCGPSKVPILKRKLVQFVNTYVNAKTLTVKPPSDDLTYVPSASATSSSSMTGTDVATDDDEDDDEEENRPLEKKVVSTMESQPTPTTAADGTLILSEEQRKHVRNIPYFAKLSDADFNSVLSKAKLLQFEAGSIIMREGNMGRTFYVLTKGEVEICQRTSFEDPLTTPSSYLGTVINRLVPGDWFGERAIITGEPRAASIRASSGIVQALVFDRDDFPPTSVLSGKAVAQQLDERNQDLNAVDDKYGVPLRDLGVSSQQMLEALKANQVRGSPNSPRPIRGVDTDEEVVLHPEVSDGDDATAKEEDGGMRVSSLSVESETIVPLLVRFKLIRLVTRCFDYIMANRLRFGEEGSRRRRNMLVRLLAPWQQVEFTNAFNLIDSDNDGEVTIIELRRIMETIGDERSDDELLAMIQTGHHGVTDGKEVITYQDFMGLMAEAEFYHLFLDTFRALDTTDSGFVRARELDKVLCGVRDLISDDRKSIIDVEDTDMMIDYEQFSKMLLGVSAPK